ncbi:ATP-binding protein [Streptosporangium vulgare]|uniref:ATP-binding protein n=1 Tax=Streptosporangium vulgare TaxID=46190 RepID=A0ABV5TIT4_9ACTN
MFAGRGDQAAPARRFVRQAFLDTERADDAEWVAAELVSNALRHTCSGDPGGHFVVEVRRAGHQARIVVYDLGGYGAPRLVPPAEGELDETGHGLPGVSALAVKVGVSGDSISGHAVWAQIDLNGQEGMDRADYLGQCGRTTEQDDSGRQVPPVPDRGHESPGDLGLLGRGGEFLDPPAPLREAS